MSAFICDPDHFKELAFFAVQRRPQHGGMNVNPCYLRHKDHVDQGACSDLKLATYYADVLYQENIRSVRALYSEEEPLNDLPGASEKPEHLVVERSDMQYTTRHPKPLAILKMLDCLECQSCETSDYRDSFAYEILGDLRRAAISALPGYEEAPWEYSRRKVEAQTTGLTLVK